MAAPAARAARISGGLNGVCVVVVGGGAAAARSSLRELKSKRAFIYPFIYLSLPCVSICFALRFLLITRRVVPILPSINFETVLKNLKAGAGALVQRCARARRGPPRPCTAAVRTIGAAVHGRAHRPARHRPHAAQLENVQWKLLRAIKCAHTIFNCVLNFAFCCDAKCPLN